MTLRSRVQTPPRETFSLNLQTRDQQAHSRDCALFLLKIVIATLESCYRSRLLTIGVFIDATPGTYQQRASTPYHIGRGCQKVTACQCHSVPRNGMRSHHCGCPLVPSCFANWALGLFYVMDFRPIILRPYHIYLILLLTNHKPSRISPRIN